MATIDFTQYQRRAENPQVAFTKVIDSPGSNLIYVLNFARNTFIQNIGIEIVTAYNGTSPTATVGLYNTATATHTADFFMANSVVLPKVLSSPKVKMSGVSAYLPSGGSVTLTLNKDDATIEVAFRIFAIINTLNG